MDIIEKIEIKNFRSFGNRKTKTSNRDEIFELDNVSSLNILSGKNDCGKSNILRALNLFFNNKTSPDSFFSFEKDYHKKQRDSNDVTEELVTIKIFFHNYLNKGKNKNENGTFLPESFWVSKSWKKTSIYEPSFQKHNIERSFLKEKSGNKNKKEYIKNNKIISNVKARLENHLTQFLNSIQFHYVPAIKDRDYFSHLYGELQQTLFKEVKSEIGNSQQKFENSIQTETGNLMRQFKLNLNDGNLKFEPLFKLPKNLVDVFKTLDVQTGDVELSYRGDGIQAKLIPEILNFIAIREKSLTRIKIKKDFKPKKYFIWGFEEPENSYEYKNAILLAERFKNVFAKNAQIFITTHSFNFISLEGNNVSRYRVLVDEKIKSSKIKKIIKDDQGFFKFDGYKIEKDEEEMLNEELGVFELNEELKKEYNRKQNEILEIQKIMKQIKKPVIFTEGETNVNHIKKAKGFLKPDMDIEISSAGNKDDLQKLFVRFKSLDFNRFKIFFVFDCDAENNFNACEINKTNFLIPYKFCKNTSNDIPEIQSGIENLFNPDLFSAEAEIFNVDEHLHNGQTRTRNRTLKKPEFFNFISERKNENDFKNFDPLFKFIEENLN